VAFVVAYQNLENHVIQPAIVGRAVNLSPPATMLAALVGGAAAGVPGALVATPLLGAVKAIYLDARGQMPEPEPAMVRGRLSRFLRRHTREETPPGGDGGQPEPLPGDARTMPAGVGPRDGTGGEGADGEGSPGGDRPEVSAAPGEPADGNPVAEARTRGPGAERGQGESPPRA
jgi:hypothetical protein